jgi:hypothetical protein
MYTMEAGIEVLDVDEGTGTGQQPFVLWLDICDEPALSRICLAPRDVFSLPKEYEDERLANGIFLSDIADVRRGASSHAFRRHSFAELRPELCVAIVGSERTLSVQFVHPQLAQAIGAPPSISLPTMPAAYDSPAAPVTGKKAVAGAGGKKVMTIDRGYFVDMLNLLAIQSLSPAELKLRGRKFQRCEPHESVRVGRDAFLTAADRTSAEKLRQLLVGGIDVDEETFSPQLGIRIYQKRLQFHPDSRKLSISSLQPSPLPSPSPPQQQQQQPARTTSPLPTEVEPQLQDIQEEEDEDGQDSGEEADEEEDDAQERTSSSSQSSVSRRNTIDSLGPNPPAPQQSSVSSALDLSFLKFDLTTQNRSLDLDDISEVRPGKVSPLIDGCSGEDSNDVLYVSIVASESILVLPVPSLVVRNNLLRRFQSFLLVSNPNPANPSPTPVRTNPTPLPSPLSSLLSPRCTETTRPWPPTARPSSATAPSRSPATATAWPCSRRCRRPRCSRSTRRWPPTTVAWTRSAAASRRRAGRPRPPPPTTIARPRPATTAATTRRPRPLGAAAPARPLPSPRRWPRLRPPQRTAGRSTRTRSRPAR